MTSPRKIVASITCVAVIGAAAILWPVYKQKAAERKLVAAAKVRAGQGEAYAQYSLGNRYRKGEGVPQDDAESVRWFRKATDQGYAQAQYALGYMYHEGKGVPRDDAEAVHWYRKAADQGDKTAQAALGYMYYQGKGVLRDDAEAVHWYRKAADQGDKTAQAALADMYRQGRRVPQDYAEALRWYRKAAEQGDKTAQAALTIMYYQGQGVPKDYTQAVHWLGRLAASCFEASNRGPLARWTLVLAIVLALLILVVPQRRWGHATWVPWALGSAACAAALAHELSGSSVAVLARGLLGVQYEGAGTVLWLAFLTASSAICAFVAVVGAMRESKRHLSGTSQGATIPGV